MTQPSQKTFPAKTFPETCDAYPGGGGGDSAFNDSFFDINFDYKAWVGVACATWLCIHMAKDFREYDEDGHWLEADHREAMKDADYRAMYAKEYAKVVAKAVRMKKICDRKITRRRAAAKAKVVRDEARWKLTVRRWADKATAQAAARLVRAQVVSARRALREAAKAEARAAARLVRAQVVAQRRADKAVAKSAARAATRLVRAQRRAAIPKARGSKVVADVVAVAPHAPYEQYTDDSAILEQLLSMTDDARVAFLTDACGPKPSASAVVNVDQSPQHDEYGDDEWMQLAMEAVVAPVVLKPLIHTAVEPYDDYMEELIGDYNDYMEEQGAHDEPDEPDEYGDDELMQLAAEAAEAAVVRDVLSEMVDEVVRFAETPPPRDRNVFTGIPADRVLLRVIINIMKNNNPGTQRELTKMLPEEYAGLDRVKVRMHIQMALVYREVVRIRTTVSSSLSRAIMKEIITKDNAAITLADLHVNTAMVMAMVDTARVGVDELFDAFAQPGPAAMKWKDGSTPKIIEQPHRRNLNLVLNNFASLLRSERISSPDLYRRLVTYMQKIDKDTGAVEITYKQPKGYKRHFADGSLGFQTMPRGVRGLLAGGLYLDVDMYCAHLVFLVWLCMKHNIPCPVSAEIVHNRAAFLERLGGKVSKHELICIVYGKSFKDKIKELAPFEDEIAGIVVILNRLYPDFERVARDYCTEKEKWCRNLQYRAVARMLAHVENNALQIIYTTLEGIGYTVGTMCFDGIMVENDSRLDIESAIISAHQAVLDGMGMTIKLVSKPFETLDMSMFSNDEVHKVRYDAQFETIGAIARIVDLDAEVAAKCGYKKLTRCGEWMWDAGDGKSFAIDDSGWIIDRGDKRVVDNILSRKTLLPELKGMEKTICASTRVKRFATIIPPDTPDELRARLGRLRAGTENPDDKPPNLQARMSFGRDKNGAEYDVMCVIAGMGAGKTYQSKKAITDYLAAFKDARCLALSCRIAYADFATGLLEGFESYQTDPGADRVVCSVESLYRLPSTDFDVVWLDEFRSLLESFTSTETNGSNLNNNLVAFRRIVSRPGVRVIITDADLMIDDAFEHVITELFQDKKVRVDIYPNLLATMKKDFMVVPEAGAYTALCEDIKQSLKVGVVCDTKTAVLDIEQLAIQLEVKHIVFHGDADQKISRAIWKDPNFAEYKLVAWNSKITNGNDVAESFDRVYYFGSSGRCASFKDGSQGIGRFRSVKNPTMCTVLPSPVWQSHGMLAKRSMEDARALAMNCTGAHTRTFTGLDAVMAPDWFTRLQCYNEVLCKDEYFRYNFIALQLSRGHNVFLLDGVDAAAVDSPDCVDDAKLARVEMTEQQVRAALKTINDCIHAVVSAEDRKRKGLATMDECILVDVYHIVKPFLIKGVEPSYDELYKPAKSNPDGTRRLLRYLREEVDLPRSAFDDKSCKHRTFKSHFEKVLSQAKVGCHLTASELKGIHDHANTQELMKLLSIPSARVGWKWRLSRLLESYSYQIISQKKRVGGGTDEATRCQMYSIAIPLASHKMVLAAFEQGVAVPDSKDLIGEVLERFSRRGVTGPPADTATRIDALEAHLQAIDPPPKPVEPVPSVKHPVSGSLSERRKSDADNMFAKDAEQRRIELDKARIKRIRDEQKREELVTLRK